MLYTVREIIRSQFYSFGFISLEIQFLQQQPEEIFAQNTKLPLEMFL